MCVGVPLKIIESAECMARGYGRNGEEQINMMLIGAQPAGTWVLTFLGSAREVISAEDAENINKALDGLTAIMQGESEINIDDYFPGLGSTSETRP